MCESFVTSIGCRNNEFMMAHASEVMVAQFGEFPDGPRFVPQ
jgi:hypothetical protein